jgi:hypothetical protein
MGTVMAMVMATATATADRALAIGALATVAPLWCERFLPFSDMPEQVAAIAMFRHWWDPAWRLQEHYALAFGDSQYVLYHLVGALLSFAVGSAETANRVLLTIVGIAFPYALRALLRSLGRDERLALFGAPLFWSAPLLMGFTPFVASVPLVTWGLCLVVHQARSPTRARWIALATLAVALFYLHVSGYLLFAMNGAGLTVVLGGGALRAVRRFLWFAPSAVLGLAWAARGTLTFGAASTADEINYIPAATLFAQLPVWARDVWGSHVDELCAVVFWASFALLAWLRDPARREDAALERAAWVPFACATVCFVALPYNVGAGTMLNTRVALFVAMSMPLLLRPLPGRLTSAAFVVVFLSTLVTAADAAYEIRTIAHEELGDINRLIDRIPQRARVLTLSFHATSPHTHWPPWTFFGAYHLARSGGVASMSFTELRHWPIHDRPEVAPPPKPPFWTLDPCLFRNGVDGPYYDFILTHGTVDPFRDSPPGPRWMKIDAEREWALYEKDRAAPDVVSRAPGVLDEGPCVK